VEVVIAGTLPLEEVAAAHRASESGHTTGKLVLTV
jgi:NADPH:quinone reductase-like Zn-dependent oxidoreductase